MHLKNTEYGECDKTYYNVISVWTESFFRCLKIYINKNNECDKTKAEEKHIITVIHQIACPVNIVAPQASPSCHIQNITCLGYPSGWKSIEFWNQWYVQRKQKGAYYTENCTQRKGGVWQSPDQFLLHNIMGRKRHKQYHYQHADHGSSAVWYQMG